MRYAIYFTPVSDAPLWHFGSSVIGYDAAAREARAFPAHDLWQDSSFVRAQATPARYGFHATLKAPFELASDATEADLLDRAAAFSERHAPILLPTLHVAVIGAFAALVPLAEDAVLHRLADACVRGFDDLRGPVSAADRARRVVHGLTARQLEYLGSWGYPYVLEEYRFHMTLTGAFPEALRSRAVSVLRAHYDRIGKAVEIDSISVMAQPERDGPFHLVECFPLRAVVDPIAWGR